MFNFRDTAVLPPKYTKQSKNTNNINRNHFKFSTKEEKLYVHDLAKLSPLGPLDRVLANALIIYSLDKDVEGGEDDSIQYIQDSGVNLSDFFCSGIQIYLLLSPYLCFISLLYLDLYVLGDDALIS